ncbi:MAG: pilin [Candidatus Harrisonbacteria bacterium]|nr:pilin [Candidatus Harrisonbacteria bacterium]
MKKILVVLILISFLFPLISLAKVDLVAPFPNAPTSFGGEDSESFGDYFNNLYKFAIGIGALFAMLIIVWAGVRYMTEAGKPFAQSDAKAWIVAGVSGLILLLAGGLILRTLNPELLDLGGPRAIVKELEEKRLAKIEEDRQARIEELRKNLAGEISRIQENLENNPEDTIRAIRELLFIEGEIADMGAEESIRNEYLGERDEFFKSAPIAKEYYDLRIREKKTWVDEYTSAFWRDYIDEGAKEIRAADMERELRPVFRDVGSAAAKMWKIRNWPGNFKDHTGYTGARSAVEEYLASERIRLSNDGGRAPRFRPEIAEEYNRLAEGTSGWATHMNPDGTFSD